MGLLDENRAMDTFQEILIALIVLTIIAVVASSNQSVAFVGDVGQFIQKMVNDILPQQGTAQ